MSEFVPNGDELSQAVSMLQALRDPTRADHRTALQSLEEYIQNPSFIMNMLHVFSRGKQYEGMGLTFDLRQLAGLVVKNKVFPNLQKLSPEIQVIIKKEVVNALTDDSFDIRKIAAILAGKISESFPVQVWSDMLAPILQMVDISIFATHPVVVDGALQATKRICEDSCLKMSLDDVNRPLDTVIPKLIDLFTCPEPSVRVRALESYNSLLYLLDSGTHEDDSFDAVYNGYLDEHSAAAAKAEKKTLSMGNSAHPLVVHMNRFIQAIAQLSSDPNAEVRRSVCQAITIIASLHVATLDPFFGSICTFMLSAMRDADEAVAIESCEFWTVLLHSGDTKRAMAPYLKDVVESLIGRLLLGAEQMEQERIDEEEESSGEKELNLRPMHHRASAAAGSGGGKGGEDTSKEEAELSARWTLRKQAAVTLDNIALSFPPTDVLSFALPKIQAMFQSADALEKESGMLALGALSTGCLEDMAPYLPQLFPFLLQHMSDPLPEMRCISCWVLSKYCGLFVENNGDMTLGRGFYEQTLCALLSVMFDAKPKVQVAACSALCILIENSFESVVSTGADQVPTELNLVSAYIPNILSAINKAFLVFGIKSGLILVDTIGTLADTVGEDLANTQYTPLYLPQLMSKYAELDDFDQRMFPMMECLTSLLPVVGLEAQSYLQHIYLRSLRIINTVMHAPATGSGAEDEDVEAPSKDFAIGALDVMSALSEGLKELFSTLVGESRDALLECTVMSMNDPLPELRQSGFSLAGEICKNNFSLLTQHTAATILDSVLLNLDAEFPLVCNNAAWTVGELALQAQGAFMQPYIHRVLLNLVGVIQGGGDMEQLEDGLKVNVAVTLGRLGIVCTAEVAEVAGEFFGEWCSMLSLTCPLDERTQAFTGLLSVLSRNPGLLLGNKQHIVAFVTACCMAWVEEADEDRPAQIVTGIRDVIVAVQGHNPSLWGKVMNKFSAEQRSTLTQMFHL